MSLKLTRAIYLIFGLIEALLVIRLVLKVLAANSEAGFAQLIYAVSGPLDEPSWVCSARQKRQAERDSSCTR
jgi:hypothetical protein